jgi:glucose-1-phosphate thymidylyltransferase
VLAKSGGHIFTYEVSNPSQYGVLTLDQEGKPLKIEEKPTVSKSNLAVTGLYFFDENVTSVAKGVKPSPRGELEITEVIDHYLKNEKLKVTHLSRGTAWLDTGNPNALHDASSYVRVIEERTGLKIGCLEEIGYKSNWISKDHLQAKIDVNPKSQLSIYLRNLIS